jgi:protocatechuate 3,4-dioxygenase beta subunit
MSDQDDHQVGRIFGRREVVRLLGIGSMAAVWPVRTLRAVGAGNGGLVDPTTPSCVVRPEQTEGPYFVDRQIHRSDIRSEASTGLVKPGQLLTLALTVSDVTGGQCRPLPGATVDVWHCDAQGVYSGVSDPRFDTVGQTFLRGVQTTDAGGVVRFTTIYPGWYSGRTVHIHFKIRTPSPNGAWEFTSQWYFDEALNDEVLAGETYGRRGHRDTTNATDGIFRNGGDELLLSPKREAGTLLATFGIGLDLSNAATGAPDGGRGGGPGRGGPGITGGVSAFELH